MPTHHVPEGRVLDVEGPEVPAGIPHAHAVPQQPEALSTTTRERVRCLERIPQLQAGSLTAARYLVGWLLLECHGAMTYMAVQVPWVLLGDVVQGLGILDHHIHHLT
jgi:hypothetical protein